MTLHDMRPLFAAKHLADHLALEPKRVGDPLVCGSPAAAANLAHNVVGQLAFPMMFASGHAPLFGQVTQIRGAGVPSQIVEAVIPHMPVVVASLATSRAWPDKRQENQTVNMVGFVNVVWANQNDYLTTISVVCSGAQSSPCVAVSPLVLEAGQDAPVCAGGVSGESWDVCVSNLLAIFWEWGECVCNHTSDYTTYGTECEA